MRTRTRTKVTLAALSAAVCGLVPTVPAVPAHAATGWRVTHVHPEVAEHDTNLQHLVVTGRSDAWAAGSVSRSGEGVGTLSRWNGKTWTNVPTPVELGWSGPVAASSARNVWAFGPAKYPATGNHAMRWNGYSWKVTSLGGFRAGDAAVLAKNDVWAVGFDDQARGNRATHWNGKAWRKVSMPDHPLAVTARTPRDVWAVGVREHADQDKLGLVSVMRWRGEKWRRVSIPAVRLPAGYDSGLADLRDVAVLSADDIWAVGGIVWNPPDGDGPFHKLLLHWNGKKWSVRISDDKWDELYAHVAPDGAGGVWMTTSAGAYVHHTKAGKVTRTVAPFPAERRWPPYLGELAHVPGGRSMLAVGQLQPAAGGDQTWDATIQAYGPGR